MSKRLIASIKNNIEQLNGKIIALEKKKDAMINERDKFKEMLGLAEPIEPAPTPEPESKPVPFMESAKKKLAGEIA